MNLRAGISRFDGFRVRCITTLPTLHNNSEYYSKGGTKMLLFFRLDCVIDTTDKSHYSRLSVQPE